MTVFMGEDGEKNQKVVSLQDYKDRRAESRLVHLASIEEETIGCRDVGVVSEGVYLLTYPSQGEGILMSPEMARKLGLALIEASAEWWFFLGDEDESDAREAAETDPEELE